MFEQDYIMRQVQQLVQVLSVVLGLKKKEKYDEALNEIGNAYKRFFEEDRKTIHSKSIDELIELCAKNERFSPDLAFAFAELIKEEAEIMELRKESDQSHAKYESALKLYEHALAEKEAAVPIDVMQKVEHLRQKINKEK